MPPTISKGKAKAIERTPLLDDHGEPATETTSEHQDMEDSRATSTQPIMRQAWRSHLLTAALVLLSICFALLLAIILLAESYAAPAWRNIDRALSQPGGDQFWKEAVPMRGPDAVNVVGVDHTKDEMGVSQLQVNISVTMRMTVDTDFIMGFREDNVEGDGWWTRKWKDIGRWGVRRLGSTTAILDKVIIYPSSSKGPVEPLLTISPVRPIPITLSPGLSTMEYPNSLSSLTPACITLLVRPSQNASHLLDFVEKSWAQAFASVQIHGSELQIYGGHEHKKPPKWWEIGRWRNWLKLKRPTIALRLKLPIPPLHMPSHPPTKPGSDLPALSDLLTLESFIITSAPSPVTPQPAPSSIPQISQPNAFYQEPDSTSTNPFLNQKVLIHEKSAIALMHLDERQLYSPGGLNIIISAQASLAHPFSSLGSNLGLNVPPLPFVVALPVSNDENTFYSALSNTAQDAWIQKDLIPVAKVYASPSFNATHIHIPLSGYVLPLSNSSNLSGAISRFVSSYLSYKSSPVAIYTPLYPSLVVRASFPPPATRLELLKNVTIENMSIRPGFGSIFVPDSDSGRDLTSHPVPEDLVSQATLNALEILATATVHARVVLPPGINIDIDVARIWIDCFVFDGEVPPENDTLSNRGFAPISTLDDPSVPEPRPLPDPLPERAFARITPKTWLNASSSRFPPKPQGTTPEAIGEHPMTTIYVTAEIIDVPLEVLPGRGSELSKFVTKVLFSSEPAIAGIRGVAAVGVGVPGLTSPASSGSRVESSELILTGLPFQGNVKVGGQSL